MKTVPIVMTVILLTIVTMSAQQPPTATSKPTDPAAAVLTALQGNGTAGESATPPEATSVTTVLDRYASMVEAGRKEAVEPPAARGPQRARSATNPTSKAVSAVEFERAEVADSLDAIRSELRALLARLDALARQEGSR